MRQYIPKKDKDTIAKRANYCCEYCISQLAYSPSGFSIEHIIPVIKGGTNVLSNLALSCQSCNNKKYTKTTAIDEVTGKTVNLYNPRTDEWEKHFQWNKTKNLLIGKTPIGRATISTLQLNRKGVVQLREVLVIVDKHPPF